MISATMLFLIVFLYYFQFLNMYTSKIGHLSARFEKLIKLVGTHLTHYVYSMITYIQVTILHVCSWISIGVFYTVGSWIKYRIMSYEFLHNFQQYYSYHSGQYYWDKKYKKLLMTCRYACCIEYTSPWTGIILTTSLHC